MITLVLSGEFAPSLCLTSFFSADFHPFLTFSRFGSPPASAAAVAALPDIKLDAESLGQTRDASSRRRVVDVCAVATVRFYLRGSRCVHIVLPFLPPSSSFLSVFPLQPPVPTTTVRFVWTASRSATPSPGCPVDTSTTKVGSYSWRRHSSGAAKCNRARTATSCLTSFVAVYSVCFVFRSAVFCFQTACCRG